MDFGPPADRDFSLFQLVGINPVICFCLVLSIIIHYIDYVQLNVYNNMSAVQTSAACTGHVSYQQAHPVQLNRNGHQGACCDVVHILVILNSGASSHLHVRVLGKEHQHVTVLLISQGADQLSVE